MRTGLFPSSPHSKSSHISHSSNLANMEQRNSEIWLQQQLKCIKKWLLQYNFINEWSTLVPAVSMWLGLHQATMGISLLLLFDFQECVICYISPCQYTPCKSVFFFFPSKFLKHKLNTHTYPCWNIVSSEQSPRFICLVLHTKI